MQQSTAKRDTRRLQGRVARYAFAVGAVLLAFVLRMAFAPLTGVGAPFILFFGATLLTCLLAGAGPAVCTVLLSLPLAAVIFIEKLGYPRGETIFQAILYAADGFVMIYVTILLQRERRRLQSANSRLSESEERYRLTVDEAPIGMALVALDGRLVRVNRRICEITGYPSEELITLSFRNITQPDDVDSDVELASRLVKGEIPRYQLAKRYIRKDRSTVDVMLSLSLLRGADGAAQYFIAQLEDITERKRAETELRRSEAKFSGIISISSDAIISVDHEQRITIFNEGAERIFGYSSDEIIGAPLDRLIPARAREGHSAHFKDFSKGAEVARTMGERREVFGLRKNGEEFPAEASISKVRVDGSMIFSVVLRDITYRKSVEQALVHAVAARDDVLGIVAHDLRNPLSTITMQVSAMEQGGQKPDRRDRKPLDVILRSASRMDHLIRDLLDVTVVEAGQMKIDREQILVGTLAAEVLESQAALATAAKLDITLDIAPDAGKILGDRNRLFQVFENLVGNAIKFTKPGGHITIGASRIEGYVQFCVTDTGAGIAADTLPRLFERFWQATTRARRLGAGLGLPITKGIVEAHGGRIWAESKEGQGTTFYFTIPTSLPDDRRARNRRLDARPTRRARSGQRP